jgi:hypothetical protein
MAAAIVLFRCLFQTSFGKIAADCGAAAMPSTPTTDNEIKCALSDAYLNVISSVTDFPYTPGKRQHDLLKIDGQFAVKRDFGPDAKRNMFTIYLQLKATSEQLVWKRGRCRYEIDIGLYNEFRTIKTTEPMYLVVLILPKKHEQCKWLTYTTAAVSIKGCAYWVSLYGAPEVKNKSGVTITIRRSNMVTAESLRKLVSQFAKTAEMVAYDP